MNINIVLLILAIGIIFEVNAQTNVSGGIYSNTTWTVTNSPYIVVDNVVVFPNVSLTIEPGVIVKFDFQKVLEIRQAALIANGTETDSITFTSNAPFPYKGIWGKVWINGGHNSVFNFCEFSYGDFGIFGADTVRNCSFYNNQTGLSESIFVDSCYFTNNSIGFKASNAHILNCNFTYNNLGFSASHSWIKDSKFNFNQKGLQISNTFVFKCKINLNTIGIHEQVGVTYRNKIIDCIFDSNTSYGLVASPYDSIIDCEIISNGVGIDIAYDNFVVGNVIENNNIGIALGAPTAGVYCNRICNNVYYNLQYDNSLGASIPNNYWCSVDSASLETLIYDGYENIQLGLVNFMPMDTRQCYLTIGIPSVPNENRSFNIFPNPATEYFKVVLPSNISKAKLIILNLLGELVYSSEITNTETKIDLLDFQLGIYLIQVSIGDLIERKKFIKQ